MLGELFDYVTTLLAGLTGFAVDKKFLCKITRLTVFAGKVSQRSAALGDGVGQNLLDSGYQFFTTCATQVAGFAFRADASHEQGFAGINISHPDDDVAVHDK